jgi:DNA gyrase/topoisomerase IV subunit A
MINDYEFIDIFHDAFKAFLSELDKYITGQWRELDFEQGGCRSEYNINKNTIVIYFGDDLTKEKYKKNLKIIFKRKKNIIFIEQIISYDFDEVDQISLVEGNKFERAYSKDVLELEGYKIVGKTKEELIQEEIAELEEDLNKKLRLIESIQVDTKEIKEKIFSKKKLISNI